MLIAVLAVVFLVLGVVVYRVTYYRLCASGLPSFVARRRASWTVVLFVGTGILLGGLMRFFSL